MILMNPLMILYLTVNQDVDSFDLRHQRHLMDGWSCFDYDL